MRFKTLAICATLFAITVSGGPAHAISNTTTTCKAPMTGVATDKHQANARLYSKKDWSQKVTAAHGAAWASVNVAKVHSHSCSFVPGKGWTCQFFASPCKRQHRFPGAEQNSQHRPVDPAFRPGNTGIQRQPLNRRAATPKRSLRQLRPLRQMRQQRQLRRIRQMQQTRRLRQLRQVRQMRQMRQMRRMNQLRQMNRLRQRRQAVQTLQLRRVRQLRQTRRVSGRAPVRQMRQTRRFRPMTRLR